MIGLWKEKISKSTLIKERSMSDDSATGIDALWANRNIVNKRWGGYEVIAEKPGWKIKYLFIKLNIIYIDIFLINIYIFLINIYIDTKFS